MLPFLFPHTLFETPTYLVAYLLAFLGAILLGTFKARQYELNPVRAVDLGIVLFVFGFIGSRLAHIFLEAPDYYLNHPIRVFYVWQGGFVLYGGVILAGIAGIVFMNFLKEPIGLWADVVAPCLSLGIAIGRVGCLAAGCCFGKVANLEWANYGLIFTDSRSGAPLNTALYPTQLLEIIFCLILTGFLLLRFRQPPKMKGSALILMIALYAVFRFFVEFLRGDDDRGLYFDSSLSTSQILSILMVIGCIVWFALNRNRKITLKI